MKKFCIISLICLLAVSFAGCGGPKGLEDLNTASGVITLDGEPIEGAQITLVPTGTGRSAGAVSDAKGVFKFQTLQANDGVADGEYIVTVTKLRTENPYTEEEQKMLNESGRRHNDVFGKDRPEPTTVNELPRKYSLPQTSGLTLTIAGNSKDLKIELVSE